LLFIFALEFGFATQKSTKAVLEAAMEVGVEVNAEKTICKEFCLLAYNVVWSFESQQTFQRNMSPSSG
jgi:hypothetical protein